MGPSLTYEDTTGTGKSKQSGSLRPLTLSGTHPMHSEDVLEDASTSLRAHQGHP
jgi:hypothetical protein